MLSNKQKSTSDVLKQYQNVISMQKIVIFMLLGFLVVMFLAVVYISRMPKTVPWVVELSTDGESTYIGDATSVLKTWSPADSTTRYFLTHYVKSLREVSTDNYVNRDNATDIYAKSLDNATAFIDEWYLTNNPIEISKKSYISVPIEDVAIVMYGADQWKVTWRETEYRRSDKQILRDEQFEAILTVKYFIPDTERRKRENPIGLYVVDFVIDTSRSLM